MTKLSEYLEEKQLRESNNPFIYIVQSTPNDVSEIFAAKVINQYKCAVRMYGNKNVDVYLYNVKIQPYQIKIEYGTSSCLDERYGGGLEHDSWSCTYFSTFNKEEAERFRDKELKRLFNKEIMKDLSETAYKRYMKVVNEDIDRLKHEIERLSDSERISKLTYDEWKDFIQGK